MQKTCMKCKRPLALFLTLIMLLSLMPTAVFAADAEDAADGVILIDPALPSTSDVPEAEPAEQDASQVPQLQAPTQEEQIPDEPAVIDPNEEVVEEPAFEVQALTLEGEPMVASALPVEPGSYIVPIIKLKSGAPIPAVKTEFAKSFGTEVQVDVAEDGTVKATIHPQHMVVNFRGTYHCNILKIKSTAGEASYPEMKTELVTPTFGAPQTTEPIECPATAVVTLPAAEADGNYKLEVTADFMNGMNGGIHVDHWMTITLTLDGANAKPLKPAGPTYEFGTQKTVLNPGVYTIPTALKHADHHEKPSMAAKAILGGKLEVMDNGDAYVNVKLGPVDAYGMHGWSTNWKIYDVYQCESQLPDAPKTLPLTEAKIVATAEEGGQTYPSEIRFKLPFTDKDGVYATMFVPVMTAYPNGFLSLDFAGATPYDPQAEADKAAAADVEAKIAALPAADQITLENEQAITEARAAYNGLTKGAKALVTNLATLEKAEAKLQELKDAAQAEADKAAAQKVDEQIAALGEITLASEQAVKAARSAYNALTDAQKALVQNLAALEAAEAKLAELQKQEADDVAAAKAVDAKIAALGKITLESKTAIEEARAAYDVLNANAKAKVQQLAVLEAAEAKLTELQQQEATDVAAAAEVDTKIAALGEITLESKTAIEEARAAYDVLNANAKAKVQQLAALEAAEAKLAELQKQDAEDTAAAAAVDAKINAIGEVLLTSKKSITEARTAYEALTEAQKAKVQQLPVLEAAEARLQELEQQQQNDQELAAGVDKKIDALGEITLDSADTVKAARDAYNALTESQKALVKNLSVLEAAEAKLAELQAQAEADKAAAKKVAGQIAAIGEVTLESEAAITAARAAFDGLTEAQQALVENADVLTAAEAKLQELKDAVAQAEADKAAAKKVADQIAAIGEVTLESEAAITAARAAFDGLTEAQQALVENATVLTAAEAKLQELKDAAAQAEADKAAAKKVADQIAAIGEVTLESEAAITEARAAFDGLTEVQQALVENAAVLAAAEAKLQELKDAAAQAEADKAAAKKVADQIAAIGEVTLESEAAITAARAAFDGLTEAQQALVENAAVLAAAEAKLQELKDAAAQAEADKAAAQKVADQIDAIGRVTLESEEAITAARKAYDGLTADQQALVNNLNKLEKAEQKLAKLQDKEQAAKDKAAAKAVDVKIKAIGKVTLESEAAIAEARSAYNALTEAQKALVKKLAVLEQAEKDLQALQEQAGPTYEFGTKKTVLKPGKYNLPTALMNASKHESPSMAAACIKGGALEVLENGDAYVNIKLGSVTVGTLVGWSSQWKIYNTYSTEGETTATEVVAKDAEGNETEIRFKLPYHNEDGVYATMFVAAVGMSPDAFISLDFASATRDGEAPALKAPVISPESRDFTAGETVEVTITAAEGAEIRYTVDGTEPTAESALYEGPITVKETTTVKAIAVLDGRTSAAAEAVYTAVAPKEDIFDGSFSGKNYDVFVKVHVLNGKITAVELSHNANEKFPNSLPYAEMATKGMQDKFTGLASDDKAAIEAVDGVTGATGTAKNYKMAVLDALGLNQPADLHFGSAKTEIQPGTYNVPIALRNADKHDKPSNAAAAFPAMGKLTVAEDGTATLETIVQPVTIGPITDMAYNLLVYQEDNYTSKTVPATILESIKKPETMPNPGIEVPTKISFTIPSNGLDGVYLNFTVDAMGGATPDGWLQIDYAKHAVPGGVEHFKGSAKVNQFGKYTIHTDISVQDGVITGVAVTADNFISETHRPTNEMKIAQASEALKNTWNGMAPIQENAEKIFKAIMKPTAPDEVIDGISGATYSGRAVRDAVMDAFNLEYQDEIINVPESVEPGTYAVQIGYYSDVVWHSLIENVKNDAVLTVAEDGSMSLSFDTLSGTDKEPLYILGFNGVYPNNDRTQKLSLEGCSVEMGLSSNDYEDEFFAKGTQVVNHVTFPLLGGLSKVYNTNAYLYVPAMKRLNGELSGVYFKDGHFSVDIFAKIYWDTMKRIDGPVEPPKPVEGEKKLVDITILTSKLDKPSMSDPLFDRTAKVTVNGDTAAMEILVAYPIPSFPEEGKDGTLKNFTVFFDGKTYEAKSDITSKPLMTVKTTNELFGLTEGDKIPAQVLTVELPKAALLEKNLQAAAFVNSVMNTDVEFAIALSNLRDDDTAQPPVPETQTAKPVIDPNGGKFQESIKVTITAEDGAVIYYTTDGSEPTENSTKYTGPITLKETATVKAAAKAEGKTLSAAASADFLKEKPKTVAPTIEPNGGDFHDSVTVTLQCADPDAAIYYTKDGSDPRVKAYKYTGPFTLTETTTLRVCAKSPDHKTSDVAEAVFTKLGEGEGVQLKDGKYYVSIALWHETHNKPSMGNAAFQNDPKALVTVSGGRVTSVQVATNPVKVGTVISAITEVRMAGQSVNVLKTAPITTTSGNDIQFIQLFSFTMPEAGQPSNGSVTYVPIQFKVPDTPMGDGFMDARIKFQWTTAQKTEDGSIHVPNKPVVPEVDKHPAVDLTDAKTGIKIHADAGVFKETVKLVVTPIAQTDEAYKTAAKALEKVGTKFQLYEVHFENEQGKEVQPSGTVTVSYPIPAGYDIAKLAVYRINDTGKATKIVGRVENGFYEVVQKSFSQYALVETGSMDDGAVNPETDTDSKTGDSTPVYTLIAMMVLSGAAIVVLLRKKREQ